MNRMMVINKLIARHKYQSYLEIGCQADVAFRAIDVPLKVGVDPVSGGTVRMKSDQYFASTLQKFDLIFIDGDHHHHQVYRDVVNALEHLAVGGTIVMHDCLPPDAHHESLTLCGTAWRAFFMTRTRPDLDSFTCDFDYGVGVVRLRPNPAPVTVAPYVGALPIGAMDRLTYAQFVQNRKTWMRPHTFAEFERAIEK